MPKTPKKLITEGSLALRDVMQEGLSVIAQNMIDQIIAKYNSLTESQQLNAIKDISPVGVAEYKDQLLTALSVIASDAIEMARKEVPKKKNVRLAENEDDTKEIIMLAEFDHLPPALQKKMKAYQQLLIDTQVADLEKAVYFQYASSVGTTDSASILAQDLKDTAEDYITGSSVISGAGTTAANVVNGSRLLFFDDPSVSEEIESYTFTNGDPVSQICQDLAGTTFSKDDPEAARYYPPLHHNAVISGTYILTPDGNKKIEDILVGDIVKTHLGNWKPVTEFMDRFEDKHYFEIELDNGKKIEITGEHPVLTSDGWKRVDELVLTDNIICLEDIDDSIAIADKSFIDSNGFDSDLTETSVALFSG